MRVAVGLTTRGFLQTEYDQKAADQTQTGGEPQCPLPATSRRRNGGTHNVTQSTEIEHILLIEKVGVKPMGQPCNTGSLISLIGNTLGINQEPSANHRPQMRNLHIFLYYFSNTKCNTDTIGRSQISPRPWVNLGADWQPPAISQVLGIRLSSIKVI